MIKLHLIAAVGHSGQIGLDNKLPWPKNHDDLAVFRKLTDGHDIIVGNRTASFLPTLPNRKIHVWGGSITPADFLEAIEKQDIRAAWLCGGAYTYRAFAPYVNGNLLINYIDYDGEADTYFPFDAFRIHREQENVLFRHRSDTVRAIQGRSEV